MVTTRTRDELVKTPLVPALWSNTKTGVSERGRSNHRLRWCKVLSINRPAKPVMSHPKACRTTYIYNRDIYMNTYVYIYTHTYIAAYIQIHIYTPLQTYNCMSASLHIYICTYLYTWGLPPLIQNLILGGVFHQQGVIRQGVLPKFESSAGPATCDA